MHNSCTSEVVFCLRNRNRISIGRPYYKLLIMLLSSLLLFSCIFAVNIGSSEVVAEPTIQPEILEELIDFTEITNVTSSKAADSLPRNGSVFCWVLTSPKYFNTRVPAVNETWLKRCDHGQFFTTEQIDDETIPFTTVFSGLNDTYDLLFYKTMRGFYYAYNDISSDFDWYLKADDDAYIIMEHLKEYLSGYNASEPHYLGYMFKPFLKKGYNSGGAGYLLSKGAVKLFAENLYHNRTICPYNNSEDVGLAICLENIGIYPTDTRNANEQHQFLPYSINQTYRTTEDDPMYTMWPERRQYDAFAPELISMHHQTPDELRMIDILLYRLNNPRKSKFFKA